MTNENDGQMKVTIDEETAQGTYTNLAMVSHSAEEFVLDFMRVVPGVASATVKARIIISPQHARRLVTALEENMARYEAAHGPIVERSAQNRPVFPINFEGFGREH